MSIYHEWFMAGADKITVKKPAETVQTASNSFFAVQTVSAAPPDSAFAITFDVQPAPETLVKHSIGDDLGNLPPIRNRTGKPLLPPELWAEGLATFAEAWRIEGNLCGQYATNAGQDEQTGLFFVRCKGWQWCEVVNA